MKSNLISAVIATTLVLLGSGNSNAQLVFDINDINGSFGQTSISNAGVLSYGAQPFVVTTALANADALEYNGAFAADPVLLPNGDSNLSVLSWNTAEVHLSTSIDALNGTPTASIQFNPLQSTAPNGQQFQDLIIQTSGANGETHYTFDPVANLGTSLDNNPFHQITQVFDINTTVTFQDNTTDTLGNFLTSNIGQTLYGSSILANGASDGIYDIAASTSLGTNAIIFNPQGGFEVDAGLAHRFTAVTEPVLLGDVNLDEEVTFADIAPFIAILSANGYQNEADCNQDDVVTFADIAPFISILSGN